ncbi:MAG TPA: dynamin family protein [Trueperaceae bacterium]|nr:dynamin family protein [Trueperaceae bacterium]
MLDLPTGLSDLVARERGAATDLLILLAKLEADPQYVADVRTAIDDLDGIFLLVVAGEFNAGKSSLVNALLGERVMPEGVTPTTDRVTVITHGEEITEVEDGHDLVRRTYPSELLGTVAFVDTPGTNAIVERHQLLTERFVPRADLVLFVTSADRPFTQSEREFLELIESWGKKVLMVVNKIDILATPAERTAVLDFVTEHARETLGTTPEVFGVSARQAFEARRTAAARNRVGAPAGATAALRRRCGSGGDRPARAGGGHPPAPRRRPPETEAPHAAGRGQTHGGALRRGAREPPRAADRGQRHPRRGRAATRPLRE